jgi:hypothetical protein
MWN